MKKIFPLALLILLFACHFPYLTADPDTITDIHTRGAWTDEGLYSAQVRNYLIDGNFNMKENSTFVRGPVFNLLQLPFFFTIGNYRLVARLIVLLTVSLAPLLIIKNKGWEVFSFFILLACLGQMHIFHFSHYALSEMICISLIFIALYFMLKSQAEKIPFGHRVWNVLLSSLTLFIAYSCKIQFIYAAGILPVTLFFLALSAGKEREEAFHLFGYSLIFGIVLIGLYATWYVGNKDFYNYVMMHEMQGRYPDHLSDYFNVIRFNFNNFLWVRELKPLWIALPIAGLIILWQRHSRKTEKRTSALLVFALVWLVFEIHKLPMSYLPNRYLLSLYYVCGLIVAYALSCLYERSYPLSWVAIILGFALLGLNMRFMYNTYKHRTYDLNKLNAYLSTVRYNEGYGLGSWAAAASWGTDMKTVPVWNDYLNADDPVKKFKPVVILTETDQSESDKTYLAKGINLDLLSDSSRQFSVWRYKVNVYWMKK